MKINKIRKILALVLVIGITVGLGSFAYFSDQRLMNGEIKLVLGTLDSNINKTVKIDSLDIEVPVSDTFVINNDGTLDQEMILKFSNPSIESDGLEKIKYSLTIESSNGKKIKEYGNGNERLNTLFNKELNLVDSDGNEVFLEAGESLRGTLTLTMNRDMPEKYSNANLNFDLSIAYTQTNSEKSS